MHIVWGQIIKLVPWRIRPLIRRLPMIAVMQRWLLDHSLNGQSFDHTIDAGPARGLRYPIQMPQDKAIWTGQYEIEFSRWLAEHARDARVCFDVGAHHGYFSGLMKVNGAEQVIAFEPLSENRDAIQRMLAFNPEFDLTVLPLALSDHDGDAEFLVPTDNSMGKLASSEFQNARAVGNTQQVRVRSVDSLVADGTIPIPDLIKVDVEGAELTVLIGARHLLASKTPVLCVEIHTKSIESEVRLMLTQFGYRIRLRSESHDYGRGANHLLATSTNR